MTTVNPPLPQVTMYSLGLQQLDIIHTVIKSIVFFYLIVLVPLVLSYTIIFPICTALYIYNPSVMHSFIDIVASTWYITPVTWLMMNGTKFTIYTNPSTLSVLQSHQLSCCSCMMVSNHPTTADWIYLWYLQYNIVSLRQLKIVMKSQLRQLIPLGWPLQFAIHFFLRRNWLNDRLHITHLIEYYTQRTVPYKLQLLLFPEGTDLHDKAVKRSNEYAVNHSLPEYKYVLHPRTTGFTYMLQLLRQYHSCDYIYDITIAYPYHIDKYTNKPNKNPQKLEQLISGVFPSNVMFYVQLFENNQLPTSDVELNKWCEKQWNDKEERLANVYSHANGKFVEPDGSNSIQYHIPYTVYIKFVCIFIGVFIYGMLSLYCMYQSYYIKLYMVFSSIIMSAFTYANGLDVFFVHRELYKRKKHAYQQALRSQNN